MNYMHMMIANTIVFEFLMKNQTDEEYAYECSVKNRNAGSEEKHERRTYKKRSN
jgi:hypothetical protein